MRKVIIAYKSGQRTFSSGIATAIALTVSRFQIQADMVVPVPTAKTKLALIGFDPVGQIAREVARQTGIPFAPILSITRVVADQVGLSPSARQKNVLGAFKATKAVSARVLLIDDVITTGATALEASRAIRVAGGREIFVVCACRTVGRFTL